MLKTPMNLELYKIVLTIVVLLAFVACSYAVEAYRARRIGHIEAACLACVVLCVIAIGLLVWTSADARIA